MTEAAPHARADCFFQEGCAICAAPPRSGKPRLILFADQPRMPPPGRWTIEEEAEERRIHTEACVASASALREQLGGAVEISLLFGFAGGILIQPPPILIESPE